MQNSNNWLRHTLESEVTNSTPLFDTEGESLPSLLSTEGVSKTSKGKRSTSEGELTNLPLDPALGEITSPNYHFAVDAESLLCMPEPINSEEAGLRHSTRTRKPTGRLIENSLFGLGAVRHKKPKRFQLSNTIL
jgi:hypothetical protein